ncbi:MAG: S8 family serine peptidase, partial [Chloroflexi bacterium]|nr:S8 family serine peptidase [Chloroflexota bacterium]
MTRTRAVILVALVAAVTLLQFGAPARQAQLQELGVVQQGVLTALESDAEVQVIISLESAFIDSESAGVGAANALKARVAERQNAVLSGLQPSDFTVEYQFGYIAALAGTLTASGAAKLATHPRVVSVALDGHIEPLLDESRVLVAADDVHVGGFDGSGIRIAVLDTGIAADHADLEGSLIGEMCTLVPEYLCPDNEDYTGNFPNPDHPAYDDSHNNHGTHVSGIITSDGNQPGVPKGIAPAAGIFMYKVLPSASALHPGDFCCGYPPVIAALSDILLWNITNPTQRYDFINMSFGDSPGFPGGYDDPEDCRV